MTYKEFMNEYKRLEDCFPNKYASPDKSATIYKFVKDLDVTWMVMATDRIVASVKGDGDLVEAAAIERRHRRSKQFADDLCAAQEATKYSEHGLDEILGKYKVKSLLEAIEKSKSGDVG